MNWTEIEIVTSNEAVDAISEILYELGISGVSIQDPHDLESFKELIAQCQKIGSELYDKGLIKPYDPIR